MSLKNSTCNKQNPLVFYLVLLIEACVIKHVIYDEFQEQTNTDTLHYKGESLLGVEKYVCWTNVFLLKFYNYFGNSNLEIYL